MSESCVFTINDDSLSAMLSGASRRVVFVAPGASDRVAAALAETWRRLGADAVSVVLDVNPDTCRLGYGTEAGIELLQKTASELGQPLCDQPGVRIGLLIVDDKTIVYSPTPLLIESTPAGDTREDAAPIQRPNAIMLGTTPPELARDLGTGPDGDSKRVVGLDPVPPKKIEELKKDLRDNPPLKFDIARYERVFNSRLEFVELEVLGCSVSRRTARIPADLMGLAKDKETRERIRSSFKVIGETDAVDAEGKLSEQSIKEERKRIADKFLVTLQHYGTVILRANRPAFETEIKTFEKLVADFGEKLKKRLDAIIAENVRKLAAALFPAVKESPPDRWTRAIGPSPTDAQLREQLTSDLRAAFGSGEGLVSEMKVKLIFMGITYQTLKEPKFIELATAKFPSLRLMEEWEAAPESGEQKGTVSAA